MGLNVFELEFTLTRIPPTVASLQRKKGQDPTMCPKLSTLAEDSGFEVIHQQKYVIEAGGSFGADKHTATLKS
jgi:hypothetical protein